MPTSVTIWLRARKHLFDASMKSVKRTLKAVIAHMQAVSMKAKFMLMFIGGAVAGLLHLHSRQEKAERKLAAVLRSTGHAAGFTASQLNAEAQALQKLTTYGDEAIMNMQAILATFVNIKGDVFRDATMSIIDMSAVLDQDLKSSVIMLGKALNDPILGVTALRRVGIQLTEQQTAQVRSFMKLGDTVKAQRVILGELKKEFGGVAEAMAQGTGRITQLKNELSDTGEIIGSMLVEPVTKLLDRISKLTRAVVIWAKENPRLSSGLAKVAGGILIVLAAANFLVKGLSAVWKILRKLWVVLRWVAALFGIVSGVMAAALAVIVGLVLWIGKLRYKIWQYNKEQKEANEEGAKYVKILNDIGQVARRAHDAKTEEDRIALLRERIKLEQKAMEIAPTDIKGKKHLAIIDRLNMEIAQHKDVKGAIDAAAEARKKSFDDALKAAQLASAQAGKTELEQEKLALLAKGFTDIQVDTLMVEKELAIERADAASAQQKREEDTANLAEQAADRMRDIGNEIKRIRGISDEALELINLDNLGHAKDDLDAIGKKLQDRVVAQTEAETIELRKQFQERLEGEAKVTAEREAQAAAQAAGRFEALTATWKRIQSAAVRAPLERENKQLEHIRRLRESGEKILKIEEKASGILRDIQDALERFLDTRFEPIAVFG